MIPYSQHRQGLEALFLAFACLVAVVIAAPAWAAPQIVSPSDEGKHAGQFIVPINKSQVLRLDQPFKDALVGNPEIADVLPLTDRSIYVLGKSLGSTSLTIYGKNRNLIAIVDLVVSQDIAGLKTQIFEMFPDEKIEIRPANGSVVLSGTVSSANRLSQVLAIADRYAPGSVTNLLSVKGSQQVMLAVRFAEVARTVVKELGFNTSIFDDNFAFLSGDGISPNAFAVVNGTFSVGEYTFDFLFDALEQKGVVKTLAEPNLIAMSGDTASFLAGGEFPVPVAQEGDGDSSVITVEFKQFGVSLAFTPTVLEEGLINIAVSPEVSRIDPANSVVVSGFSIPGLATRRATTTVELRDGQSFAIAGLLQNDFQDTVRQFPLLGDVPVLGTLVRSSDFARNESELVIVVTPHLVTPAPAGSLATPADRFVPPSDVDIFLFGRTEAPESGLPAESGVRALSAQGAGGIAGPYGHIIK